MMDVRVAGYSLRDVLTAPPKISDQTDGVCRTLTLSVQNSKELAGILGQTVELYKGTERHFYGKILRRGLNASGGASYTAFDPLLAWKKFPDDYYYKKGTVTATKVFQDLAKRTGVPVGKLANTKVVMPALYYQGGEPNKIAVDTLARTKRAGGKNFWFRFDPSVKNFGLQLFEKTVPKEVWAFQTGINLLDASFEESAEEIITQVKLVNRETGKVVTRKDTGLINKYGAFQHFEEVDKEQAGNMDRLATSLLKEKSRVVMTSNVSGLNPGNMPMFYSGDVVYVEERNTGLLGAYHIKNVEQEYVGGDVVTLAMDIERAASIPDIEYEDATTNPNAEKKTAKKTTKKSTKKKKEEAEKDKPKEEPKK